MMAVALAGLALAVGLGGDSLDDVVGGRGSSSPVCSP